MRHVALLCLVGPLILLAATAPRGCGADAAPADGPSLKDPGGAWELQLPPGWVAGPLEEVLSKLKGNAAVPPGIVDALGRTSVQWLAVLPMDAGGTPVMPGILFVMADEEKKGEVEVHKDFAPDAKTAATALLVERLWPGCVATIETARPGMLSGRKVFEMEGFLALAGRKAAASFHGAPAGGRMHYLILAIPTEGQSAGKDAARVSGGWKLARPAKTASFVYTRTGKYVTGIGAGCIVSALLVGFIVWAMRRRHPNDIRDFPEPPPPKPPPEEQEPKPREQAKP